MKKIGCIVFAFIFVVGGIFLVLGKQKTTVSANNTSGFAVVLENDAYLFKNADLNAEKYFLLEQTYYVKVLEDYNNLFYRVEYLNLTGFVLKNKITFVEEFPEMPYLSNITFDIVSSNRVTLRSQPSTRSDNSVLEVLDKGTKDIMYYGKIAGEEAINGLGNIWYYCSFSATDGNTYYGYVYAPLTANLTSIKENSESYTAVNVSAFSPLDNLLYLNLTTQNIIICLIALPTIVILFLFLKPNKEN